MRWNFLCKILKGRRGKVKRLMISGKIPKMFNEFSLKGYIRWNSRKLKILVSWMKSVQLSRLTFLILIENIKKNLFIIWVVTLSISNQYSKNWEFRFKQFPLGFSSKDGIWCLLKLVQVPTYGCGKKFPWCCHSLLIDNQKEQARGGAQGPSLFYFL